MSQATNSALILQAGKSKRSLRELLLRLLVAFVTVLVVIYLVIAAAIFFLQRKLEYPGARHTAPITQPMRSGWQSVTLNPRNEGTHQDNPAVTVWQAHPSRGGAPTIVMFGGNDMGTTDLFQLAEALRLQGYGAILAGYRGYSGNAGDPTETGLLQDGQAALDLAAQDGPVILFGHSLGAAVAATLAAANPGIGGLVLSAPFTSATEMVSRRLPFLPMKWLMQDRFDVLTAAAKITCPVLIIHGDQDRIIPLSEGRRVAEALGSKARLSIVEGGDHNSVWLDGLDGMQQFIAELFPSIPASSPSSPSSARKRPHHRHKHHV